MDAEKAAQVCELVSQGESLRAACEAVGTTHPTFLRWCAENKELADQYAHAREAGSDVEFESLAEMVSEQPQTAPNGAVDAGWVAWKRLQVDTKKWSLSKKAPRKYGDRLELNGEMKVTNLHQELAALNAVK